MYITITAYIITTIFVINSILLLLSPGTSCTPKGSNPQSFSDGFDDASQAVTNRQWSFILGASMGQGCGVIKMDNSLYFNDVGPREAETSPVNTTAIKYVILNVHLKERNYFIVLELVYTVVISSVKSILHITKLLVRIKELIAINLSWYVGVYGQR